MYSVDDDNNNKSLTFVIQKFKTLNHKPANWACKRPKKGPSNRLKWKNGCGAEMRRKNGPGGRPRRKNGPDRLWNRQRMLL